VTQDFPLDCAQSHTIQGWEGASFSHVGIVTGCADCHLDNFQSANDPDHVANGFSTTCEQCHSTNSWGDGTFDHAEFPIQSGDHAGLSCQDCHPTPGAFRQSTCVSCHTHSPRETNGEHDDVRGYTYQSSACYDCHSNGQRD
jgi:hypothetical protein